MRAVPRVREVWQGAADTGSVAGHGKSVGAGTRGGSWLARMVRRGVDSMGGAV
ncbi:MAG: hypothetical protein LIO85_09840 [Rikenellaceae bacterium]|nr:hypothetical protein [Rikenellaceae bacterium]